MKKLLLCLLVLLSLTLHWTYRKRESIALWWAIESAQPDWAQKQLAADFAPFATITQEALNQTFHKIEQSKVPVCRYRIIDGKIFRMGADHPLKRTEVFEKMLRRLQKAKKLPAVDFIVCMQDGVPESYVAADFWLAEQQAPLLAWAKRKAFSPFVVLIPDGLTTKEASWHKEIEMVNEKYRQIPWEQREEIAFWRGGSNDKGYTLENYHQKPRFLISALSQLHPSLIDAGFAGVRPMEVAQVIGQLGFILGNTPVSGHLSYKYLPVLDGYMCTYPGFQWRLFSGSLILKQESDEIQYFYSALKPYEHYVPVKNDMSDLVEKISWAKTHDVECRQIAENARAFAMQNLRPEPIYAYLYWVLAQHERLQAFDVSQEPLGSAWRQIE